MYYTIKDLQIDIEARCVFRGDESLQLPDLSFDLLVYLLGQAPKVASAADISAGVWRAEYVSDETIAQRITLLRKALNDNAKDAIYIRTVRGAGYTMSAPVQRLDYKPEVTRTSHRGRFNFYAAMVGCAALLIAVMALWLSGRQTKDDSINQITPKSTVSLMIEQARTNLSLHQSTETERAIKMLRDVLIDDPGNFEARLVLSFALTTKATKFDGGMPEKKEAEAIARALINENPESSNAWSALAYTLGAQGRPDESLASYRRAYQLEPQNASAISSAAYEHLTRGELYDALKLEMRAKAVGGSSRYAEIQIAQSLELIEHPATDDWQARALSLNPNQVVIVGELARSYIRRGNPQAAHDILLRIEGEDMSAPLILQLKGRVALALGSIDEARVFIEAAGERALFDRAALAAMKGDTSLARELINEKKLAELEADVWPGTWVHLAEITAVLGHDSDAHRYLTQAVNYGWRDIKWLEQSPFLRDVIASPKALALKARIKRELAAQKLLIQSDETLSVFLQSEYAAVFDPLHQ